jgi:ATP-binding cassette, subfamily B, multidrug efflux pump
LLAPLLMLLEVVMDLMQPRMVQRIVDEGHRPPGFDVVLQTGLMDGRAGADRRGGRAGCGIYAERPRWVLPPTCANTFRKVQTFSFGNLDELDTGQLITRLTNDVTQVQEAVAMMLRILVRARCCWSAAW